MKLLYKPFGIVLGILAGQIAKRLFKAVWGRIDSEHDKPPKPTTLETTGAKAVGAAAVEAAIAKGVKAGIDRAGAKGFYHLTGVWPGEKRPEPVDG